MRGHELAREVAAKYGLTLADIRSTSRIMALVAVRQEVCFRLMNETNLTAPQIGRIICRDHSTVYYGASRHAFVNGLHSNRGFSSKNCHVRRWVDRVPCT